MFPRQQFWKVSEIRKCCRFVSRCSPLRRRSRHFDFLTASLLQAMRSNDYTATFISRSSAVIVIASTTMNNNNILDKNQHQLAILNLYFLNR